MRISDWSSDVCSSDLNGHLHNFAWNLRIVEPHWGEVFGMAGKAVSLDQHPLPGACQGLHPRCLACFAGRAEVGGTFLDDSPAKLRHAGGRSAFAWGKRENMAIDNVALFDQAEAVLEHLIARSEEHTSELPSLMRISY